MPDTPEAAALLPDVDANKPLGISGEEELDCPETPKWHSVTQ